MPTAGIKVLFVGSKAWPIEGYQIEVCTKINQLLGQIAKFKPDVIVSSEFIPGALNLSGFEVRKKWLHLKPETPIEAATNAIESCYASIIWKPHPYAKDNPLISVYTPTYNTGDFLRDTYASLRDQTYVNWEWVVIDDGSTDGTWERLKEIATEDYRVRPMQSMHIGKIGALKGAATKLAYGEFVVELDHDDMLTDTALEEVRKAFLDPEVGMVYSNCAAFFQNGAPQKYGGDFWESKYREVEYRGKKYQEARGPDIYDRFGPNYWQQFGWFLTVGPNHLRAYRRSKLEEFGGYNPALPVADDWDVYARFFLRSKCVWIDKMLYLYRFLDGYSNTTFTKNKSIQDHLELGRRNYAAEFDAFNKRRLNPAAVQDLAQEQVQVRMRAPTNILLTVAVTSVAERLTTDLPRIMGELFKQAQGKPVEVLGDIDNRKATISEKRNRCIQNAQGKFISFVDDDDAVAPDYVDELVKAIQAKPDANVVVFDEECYGYTKDGGPPTPDNPAITKTTHYGLEYEFRNAPDAYYRKPNNRAAWRTEHAREVPFKNVPTEDDTWGTDISAGVALSTQARVSKVLYKYTFDPKTTLQKTQDKVIAERTPVMATPAVEKVEPSPYGDLAFVVASRTEETAKRLREELKLLPAYFAIGKPGILEAYEEGRLHFKGVPRIVYVHDDLVFKDLGTFCETVRGLAGGTHGPCGSGDPAVLDKNVWWEHQPCYGGVQVGEKNPEVTPEGTQEVRWLDGCCLIAVNQQWSWKVRGAPALWHGYDWLACKRTIEGGGKCFTLPHPKEYVLRHDGYGRMEGYIEAMTAVRALTREPQKRNDWPNIHEHYGLLRNVKGTILDLGCNEGVATSAFLEGVEKDGGHVWSVDITDRADIFKGHIQWTFTKCDSLDDGALRQAGLPEQLDVLFIDTDHTYERTKKELALWVPRVKPGGTIIMHDLVSFPSVAQAFHEYFDSLGHRSTILPNCNGLAVVTVVEKVELKPHGGSLSVVVIDWNTKDKTLSCIHSVRSFYPDAEIVLVQNGEKFDCPEANEVIPLELNVGYSAGVNRGVMAASREYVCLLNSDTIVRPPLFEKLLAELQDPTVGIVAPYASQARPPQGDYAEKDCPQDSQDRAVVFVCVVLRKSLFDELGGMDPRLCTYEDDDFCRRLLATGLKSRVVGGAWIKHEGHASFEANKLDHLQVEAENKRKYNAKWPKVAVVTLTKDEREALPGFFEQFKSVTRDFAALDSGSTDGTVEWAKENGVRVTSRHFTRFDEQRNAAIKLAKGCDWVVMLDPDERLDEHTIKCIPDLVRSDEFDIYLAPLRAENRDGSFTEWVGKPFLFRNKPEIRWALPVHEKLIGSKRQAWVKNAMITHVIALHEQGRRQQSENLYAQLAVLPAQDVSGWPILDYTHRDHPDIEKIWTGPLVSVVIPSYNRLRMLARAVESVKLQDYRPVEVVVVGDACGQLQDLAASGNMTVVNLPTNHGAGGGAPRNYGIALASGQWVAFLDDDNEWTPDHLSSLMEAVEKTGAEFGISSMKTLGKDLIFREPKRGQMDTSCLLHRKNLVERFGWWGDRVEKGYAHDWEFIRPWVEAGVKYVMTQKPTCLYSAETSGQHEFLKSLVGEARG